MCSFHMVVPAREGWYGRARHGIAQHTILQLTAQHVQCITACMAACVTACGAACVVECHFINAKAEMLLSGRGKSQQQ